MLAIVPGVSRSGATILGGELLGIERAAIAHFTFYLAVPTMFGATALQLYKKWSLLSVQRSFHHRHRLRDLLHRRLWRGEDVHRLPEPLRAETASAGIASVLGLVLVIAWLAFR